MTSYIFRRLLAFIPTVFISVTIIFIFTRMVPGNPVYSIVGHQGVSAEQVDVLIKQLGYDKPILEQYMRSLNLQPKTHLLQLVEVIL